jgi:hypothetical protein
VLRVSLGLLLLLLLSACAAPRRAEPPAAVATVREAERRLGIEPTGNFASASDRPAYNLCFFTGKLELPDSYNALRWKEIKDGRCPADLALFDVFTYRAEAVAGRDTPVTQALAEAHAGRTAFVVAHAGRTAFVVAHEDFHDQPTVRRLPDSLNEAAATLAGLLTAIEHAHLTGEPASAAVERATGAPEAFARKSERTNALFRRLRALYSQAKTGAISREDALARKKREFDGLAAKCTGEERLEAFHACPAAFNNAGLSFDHTYTEDYPLLWEAHRAFGGDAARTVSFLRGELPCAGRNAEEIRAFVRRRIAGTAAARE